MSETLPVTVRVEAPDGRTQPLLRRGAALPAQARAVFATQRASERELALRLTEEDAGGAVAPLAEARCELPPGLPPNTWLAVEVEVSPALALTVEVRENLRRLRLTPELTLAPDTRFNAGA